MMLRSFVAVEIPAEIQSALARSTAPLQKALPKPLIRWVAPQNVHLTLKFLGDVSPTNLERLAEALKAEAVAHETFSMSVGGLGAFPTPRRARIIWIGLEAPASLMALLRGVEAVTARLGYASEDRPFSPHLTIGRVGQNVSGTDFQRIRTALEGATVGALGTLRVDAVHIFKSDLQPGGSVYTHLYTLPMQST
ncbi:MAG: RNA 2',3'-cyclic phosphodiesterase [Candidatus Atribacteria bacterium]|nr:RNA 2',3'-cyclic phosphodiesterase [Candidatus Atribacteria bacterium]